MTSSRLAPSFTLILAVLLLSALPAGLSSKSKLKKCPNSQSARYHNCFGAYFYAGGNKYVGEWRDNKRHGQGEFTFADGKNRYVGSWRADKRSGLGTFFFADGNKYSGEWSSGKQHGKGTLTYADGSTYVGQFRNGQLNGYATYSGANGNKHTGGYKNHKKHGQGTFVWANGNEYSGHWKDNTPHSQGTFTFSNGDEYTGERLRGQLNGKATVAYANGDRYSGSYVDDQRQGLGTYTWADGSKYAGEWKRGVPDGVGSHQGQDGQVLADVKYTDLGRYSDGGMQKPDALVYEVRQRVATVKPSGPEPASQPAELLPTPESKVALVIGNEAYEHTAPLANPKNDANGMSAMLKRLGFDVVSGTNLDKREIEQKIREFIRKSRQADLSLFFYAGHGIQVAGQNYLLPVDAVVKDDTALDFELVNVSMISNYMGGLGKVGIILLDACRDNPLSRSLARSLGTRSAKVSRGLATISTPDGGLLVGFATAPGDVAADGKGKNSPFTTALLKHLPTPGLEIELLMKRVKAEVISMTKNGQRPWHNSDLAKEVYLLRRP